MIGPEELKLVKDWQLERELTITEENIRVRVAALGQSDDELMTLALRVYRGRLRAEMEYRHQGAFA